MAYSGGSGHVAGTTADTRQRTLERRCYASRLGSGGGRVTPSQAAIGCRFLPGGIDMAVSGDAIVMPMHAGTVPLLGILMLNTRFPRPPGDIGNPETWPFPVRYEVVEPATVGRVVAADPPVDLLLAPFVAAGQRLVAAGARAITTSCGFLTLFQAELTRALPVPVMTSSLIQASMVQASLPRGKRVGIVTIDAGRLSPAHLASAGVPPDTPIAGVEHGDELHRIIMADLDELDPAAAEADVFAAGDALLAEAPDVGALVLECTNMAPYARALSARLGLPVYDIVSLITWLHGGHDPRAWE